MHRNWHRILMLAPQGRQRPQGRRFRRLVSVVAATLAVVLGSAGLASALSLKGSILGIPIPVISQPTPNAPTPPSDPVPAVPPATPAPPAAPSADSLLGILNIPGGLDQTSSAIAQAVAALSAVGVVVQTKTVPTAQAQIDLLNVALAKVQADIVAGDTAKAQADLQAEVTRIQGAATALGLTTALDSGLSIAQNVLSPVCALAAIPTSFAPGIGLDLSRTYNLASPTIQQTDVQTDALIKSTYNAVYAQVIALLNGNATTAAVPGVLTLLQFNWTTDYQAPDGTHIIKTAPGLANIPTPIDVDNSGTFDICAMAGYALDLTTLTGTVKQTITKMPLAKANLPLKVTAPLLGGAFIAGYDTTTQPAFDTDPATTVDNSASTAPVSYAATNVGSLTKATIDTAVAVHRGTTLTLPPAQFNALPALPTFPPLVEPAPTPKLTQTWCPLSCAAGSYTNRYDNEANALHLDVVGATAGETFNFTGSAPGDRVSTTASLLSGFGGLLAARSVPAPTALSYCGSTANGTCAASPHAATDKGSLKFSSSSPVHFDQSAAATTGTTCAGKSADVHVDGTNLRMANTPVDSAGAGGKAFVDTGGQTIAGCVGYSNATTGIPAATFPTGSTASSRDANYHNVSVGSPAVITPIPDQKTGGITCPASTVFTLGISASVTAALTPVLCPTIPKLDSGPTITGDTIAEAQLTANSTWTPAANSPTVPNSPTLSYVWSRCDASGGACSPIAGETGPTYVLKYGTGPTDPNTDIGHTFRVTVKGTNLDGSFTSAPSAATGVVANQSAAPANTKQPTITGVPGTGHVLTANSALTDWSGGVSPPLTYQWQKCAASGSPCSAIGGATASTFTPVAPGDLDSTIQVIVTASNHVGSTPATSPQVRIQPAPVNTAIPDIQRCLNAACTTSGAIPAGSAPFTGDKLKVTDGTWQAGTATGFAYKWIRCDADGTSNCAPIGGATTNRYTVSKTADLGKTLKAEVTANNDNLNPDTTALVTVVMSATSAVVSPAKPAVQQAFAAVEGAVNAIAPSASDTTYVAGQFDIAGTPVGGAGAEYLAATPASNAWTQGAVANGAQVTGGVVKAIAPDANGFGATTATAGGYFIGGNFTHVQGVPCPAFAHIAATGALDQSFCNLAGIAGEVRAIAGVFGTYGNASPSTLTFPTRIAVGGAFTTTGGRSNLMYIDPTPAVKTVAFGSNGDPNGAVNAFASGSATFGSSAPFTATQNGRIYFGGDFTAVGPTVANHLARDNWAGTQAAPAIVADTAFSVSLTCTVPATCATGSVKTLAMSGTAAAQVALLVGGSFDTAKVGAGAATPRNNAAAFTVSSFAITTWNPGPDGPVNVIVAATSSSSTNPGAIFLGGSFANAGGMAVKNFVAYGITSAGAVSAAPAGQLNGAPSTSFRPELGGPVNAISFSATSGFLAIGGGFTTAGAFGATSQARHNIALYTNVATSTSTAGAAVATLTAHAGNTVYSLGRDGIASGSGGPRLLAGGAFKILGGKIRKNVAEIGTSGVTGWTADTDGPVTAVAANTANVYLSGAFTTVNGVSRPNGLAALDRATGAVVAGWTPSVASGVVKTLAANDTAVYAGGSSLLAALHPATGAATSWNPGVTGTVNTIVLNGANVLVGGVFTNAGGQPRTNAAAIDATTGAATNWTPNPDGAVNAISVDPDDNTAVFLGGAFANAGGAARARIAKVDDTVGTAAASWNPGASGGSVLALLVFSGNVYVGGDFASVGGQANPRLAGIDAVTGDVLDWQPTPSGAVRAIALTSGGLIAIGGDFVTFNPPVTGTNPLPVFSYKPGFALLG